MKNFLKLIFYFKSEDSCHYRRFVWQGSFSSVSLIIKYLLSLEYTGMCCFMCYFLFETDICEQQ